MKQNHHSTTTGTALAPRTEGNLVVRSPWEELTEMRYRMDDLFSRAFGYTPLARLFDNDTLGFEPAFDLYEQEEKFVLIAPLPGYTLDTIQVEATPGSITVHGERQPLYTQENTVTHRQTGIASSGRFQFNTTLPTEIDPNKIKATLANGVLQLEAPKTEQARAKSVKVKVTAA